MIDVRDSIQQLEQLGFTFSLTGDGLTYDFTGNTRPDPAAVRDLLQVVTAERDAAVMLLRERLQTITLALSPEIGRTYSWGATVYRLASLIDAPAGWVGTFEEVPAGRVFMVNIEPYEDPPPAIDPAPAGGAAGHYNNTAQEANELSTQQTKAANDQDRPLPWATSD